MHVEILEIQDVVVATQQKIAKCLACIAPDDDDDEMTSILCLLLLFQLSSCQKNPVDDDSS
jgi:hypothetical protein